MSFDQSSFDLADRALSGTRKLHTKIQELEHKADIHFVRIYKHHGYNMKQICEIMGWKYNKHNKDFIKSIKVNLT